MSLPSPPRLAPILLLALGACTPDAATAPETPPVTATAASTPSRLAATAERREALGAVVLDLRSRVLPAMAEDAAGLRASVEELQAALDADDAPALHHAIRTVLREAAALGARRPDLAADLGGLTLTLGSLDAALPDDLRLDVLSLPEVR